MDTKNNGKQKLPSNVTFCVAASCFMAILYLIGMADLEYGYYSLLRIFSFLVLPLIVLVFFTISEKLLTVFNCVIAVIWILFNPVAPIYLDKDTWVILDAICGLAMYVYGFYALIYYKRHGDNDEKNT